MTGGIGDGAQVARVIIAVTGDKGYAVNRAGLHLHITVRIVAVLNKARRIGDCGKPPLQVGSGSAVVRHRNVLGVIAVKDIFEPSQKVVAVLDGFVVLNLETQVAGLIVAVMGNPGVGRIGAHQTAQVIVGVNGDVALGVGDGGQVAVGVVGVGGSGIAGLEDVV